LSTEKKRLRVGVLFGGRSGEHEVSLISAASVIQALDKEKSDLVTEMSLVADKLTHLNECVQRHSSEIGRQFGAVHDEVRSILPSLRFPELIEECYGPAERLCEQLLACTSGYACAENLDSSSVARIDAHKGHYTMQSERETHSMVLSKVPDPILGESTVESPVAVGLDLGRSASAPPAFATNESDGIELF